MRHPELAAAVIGVLAFVRQRLEQMSRAEVDQFSELATKVCVEAVKAGLGDRLPKIPELAPALNHADLPGLPRVQYESRLLLPGDWTDIPTNDDDLLGILRWQDGDPQPPPERVFHPSPPPMWFRTLEELLALAEDEETAALPSTEQPTIWHHGGKSYSADGQMPVVVSTEKDNVLQAFLDRDEASDTKTLRNCGVSNVTAVIKKLAEQFGRDAITRPKKKGDGYFIRVRSRKSN
jgi:hypothetical protein